MLARVIDCIQPCHTECPLWQSIQASIFRWCIEVLPGQHTLCGGVFRGGDVLGHGEEAVTKESVVGAELHQLHEIIAAHLGVVDVGLQRVTRIICKTLLTPPTLQIVLAC